MSDALENELLERLFSALRQDQLVLPTLPEMALRVRDLLADPDSSMADVARAVSRDPALSARLIQIVNSPLLRARTRIDTIEMAVVRLGSSMIRNIVTGLAMEQLFQATTDVTDRKLRTTWRHAWDVSSLAMGLCLQHPHLQSDQAMLAGLVHDIGILPLLTLAEEYPTLLEDEARLDRLIARTHCELGRAILEHWHFPESLVAVASEHENLAYEGGDKPDYVHLIIVANLHSQKNSSRCHGLGDLTAIPAFARLGLTEGIEIVEIDMAAF